MRMAASERTGVVLTFGLADALFALPVAPVVEILDAQPVAPLPNAPAHLLGLIDRRGVSVPVVDLRLLMGMPPRADDPDTRIVVLRPDAEEASHIVGLRLDRVFEVTELDHAESAPLPEAGLLGWDEAMVSGIGRRNGAFISVLRLMGLFEARLKQGETPVMSAT